MRITVAYIRARNGKIHEKPWTKLQKAASGEKNYCNQNVNIVVVYRDKTHYKNGRKINKAKQLTIDLKSLQHLTHFTNGKSKNTQTHEIRQSKCDNRSTTSCN